MKVVSPYRPFAPESPAHRKLGPFDWPAALGMLRTSVARSCRCETYALTDEITEGLGACYRYRSDETRLMLWILEVSERYLASPDFDDDTVLISPDALVFADLRVWFRGADLGIVVRGGKFAEKKPLLNAVQFWAKSAQSQLVAFYRKARVIAADLPEETLRWGADTVPLRRLLDPIRAGRTTREGLAVFGVPHSAFFRSPTTADMARLALGRRPADITPIVDFKYLRKHLMPDYFRATLGAR